MSAEPTMYYRKRNRNEKTRRICASLRPQTVESLQRIQTLFEGRYPSLSCYLDDLLNREAERLNADPEALAQEVAEFERRYLRAK